jgi:hypothetical protein
MVRRDMTARVGQNPQMGDAEGDDVDLRTDAKLVESHFQPRDMLSCPTIHLNLRLQFASKRFVLLTLLGNFQSTRSTSHSSTIQNYDVLPQSEPHHIPQAFSFQKQHGRRLSRCKINVDNLYTTSSSAHYVRFPYWSAFQSSQSLLRTIRATRLTCSLPLESSPQSQPAAF